MQLHGRFLVPHDGQLHPELQMLDTVARWGARASGWSASRSASASLPMAVCDMIGTHAASLVAASGPWQTLDRLDDRWDMRRLQRLCEDLGPLLEFCDHGHGVGGEMLTRSMLADCVTRCVEAIVESRDGQSSHDLEQLELAVEELSRRRRQAGEDRA